MYSVLVTGAPTQPGAIFDFTLQLTTALTLEALSTILIVLLPFRFLDGRAIFDWSKSAWAGAYFVATALFSVLVVPISDNLGDVSAPILGWTTLFTVFAAIAVGTWAAFRFIPVKPRASQSVEEDVRSLV